MRWGEVGDPYLNSWASMDYPMTSGNLSGIAPVSVEPPLRLPNYLDQYPEELQDAHNKLLDKFIDGKITKAEFHKKRDAMGISDYLIRGSSKLNKSMEEFSGYRRGGELTGPAPSSPIKDNLTIKAQAGEYVVPKKVVDVLGSNYFDDMVTQITGKKPMPKPKGQTFTPGPSSNSPAFQTGGKVGAEGQTGDGWQPPASLPGTTGYNSDNNIYTNPEWQPKLSNPMIGWSGGNDGKPPSAFFENKGLQQYWHDYYDNPRNHYAGNWAGNPDDMVQINRGNRGGPGMAGPNDMANELGKRRQGRGGGRFSGPVFNQRSNLSDRPAGGYPLLQGYPQGSAPWDYGQNPSGVWGNAGNYNVSGESHRAGQDAMAFAGNTWGQGMVHDPEVGMWRNENRPIAGQHVDREQP